MQIPFQTTVMATIIGVAFGAISGQEAAAARLQDYNSGQFRAVLSFLGYNVPSIEDEPLIDNLTRQAIREFQSQYNIKIDGIAGSQTQDVAADIVRDVRYKLNMVMEPNPPLPDSQFADARLNAVVKQFQLKFDLPVTGLATLEVRNKIEQASKERSNNPVEIYTPQAFIAVLYGLGYNVDPDSQLTEPRTQQAIREFQRHYNLVVDGIAGVQTQNLAGNIVRILQYNLNLVVRPDPPLPQSYYYGSQTQAAVRRFQQLFNLPMTGIASLEVRTKLNLAAQRVSP